MSDGSKPVRLPRADRRLQLLQVRLDLFRDTRLSVQRNVSKHVHITIGSNEATIIMHPHAAKRLCANIQAVLEGNDYAAD